MSTTQVMTLCADVYSSPDETPTVLPDDRENMQRGDPFNKFTRVCFLTLERENVQHCIDAIMSLKRRLFRGGRFFEDSETGCLVTMDTSYVDNVLMELTMYIRGVLGDDRYSHLRKIPIFVSCELVLVRGAQLESDMWTSDPKQVPAARAAIDALQRVLGRDGDEVSCRICLDQIERDMQVARMPCNHKYHLVCIVRWLETSHLCPLCRFALPTC